MVSTRPPTAKSSSPYNNTLVTIPKAPITIGIILTSMFYFFFKFSSKVEVLILRFTFFQFYSLVSRNSGVNNFANSLFFFVYYIRYGLLAEISCSVCMSKSNRSLCVSFSRTDTGLCMYHLFISSNLLLLLLLLLLLSFIPLEFFTSVLAGGFSLEFEWQQVSSSLQDSSHDSGRS